MDSTTNTVYYDLNSAVRQLTDSVAVRVKTDLCLDMHDLKSFIVATVVRINEKIIAVCSRVETARYDFHNLLKYNVYYDCSLDSVLSYHTNSESNGVSNIIRSLRSSDTNIIISIYEFADKRLKLTDRYVQIDGTGSPATPLGDIIILSE